MATTTNYGWTTPNDTDLVKDGAAAIRTLGSSIDTTTKALNPSTTLGDIEYRSATANTNTRLGVGSNGQFLSVAGGVPSWVNASSGALTYLTGASFSSVASVSMPNNTFTSTYQNYKVFLQVTGASGVVDFAIRYRTAGTDNTNASYRQAGATQNSAGGASNIGVSGLTEFSWGNIDSGNATNTQFEFSVLSPQLAQYTTTLAQGTYSTQTTTTLGLMFHATTQFDAMTFRVTSGTFSGNYRVYGIANS